MVEQREGINKAKSNVRKHRFTQETQIIPCESLLGSFFRCQDVSTRMVYTHVLNRGGRGVRSPVDSLGAGLDGHFDDYNIRK